jgi:hypothetical protein
VSENFVGLWRANAAGAAGDGTRSTSIA